MDQFATRFPVNVIVDMLGLDRADHDRFHALVHRDHRLPRQPGPGPDGRRGRAAHERELAAYMMPMIRERRAAPGDDLLSALCTAEVDGTTMSDEDIKAFCSLLLAAGGETTDKAIAGMFRNLLPTPSSSPPCGPTGA